MSFHCFIFLKCGGQGSPGLLVARRLRYVFCPWTLSRDKAMKSSQEYHSFPQSCIRNEARAVIRIHIPAIVISITTSRAAIRGIVPIAPGDQPPSI
jgi:hypothetical protein